jgi:hypothetical protein
MTTHVVNPHSLDKGVLLRLVHGEPLVRWDGDKTEYRTTWGRINVTASDEYFLPKGRFDDELWVDANDDVWRRKVMATAYPCEPGFEHLVGRNGEGVTLCWYCAQPSSSLEPTEFFVLVSAEGFPADCPARPQQRAEVEEYAGELMRIGSVEARARSRAADAAAPTPGGAGGCMLSPMSIGLAVLLCLVVGVAGRIIFGLTFQ